MPSLSIRDLTVEYERGGYVVRAVDGVSVEAHDGELVLLLGPSGCGKTTLLSCLAGILRPTQGQILMDATDITGLSGEALDDYRCRTVGIVFQAFNLIPSLTALENVAAPLRLSGTAARRANARAHELLTMVGLAERMDHRPGDLSGGQQQRVAIARGLALDPPVVLADEPTAHLDYIQVEVLLRLLRRLAAPGRILVIATHDDRLVPLADRVVELAPRHGGEDVRPESIEIAAGETIFEQGSRGSLIYVVERGSVEIVREFADDHAEVLATVGPGEYFGELGPLLGFPRTATARAAADTVLTGYGVHAFKQRAGGDPAVAALFGRASAMMEATAPNGGTRLTGRGPRENQRRARR
jgi:putative ABC transport system ATP-binding protein